MLLPQRFQFLTPRILYHSIFLANLQVSELRGKYLSIMFLCFAPPDTFSFVQECGFHRYDWVTGVGTRWSGKKEKGTRQERWLPQCSLGIIPVQPHWRFFNIMYIQDSLLPTSRNPKVNELMIMDLVLLAQLASMGRWAPSSRSPLCHHHPLSLSPLQTVDYFPAASPGYSVPLRHLLSQIAGGRVYTGF